MSDLLTIEDLVAEFPAIFPTVSAVHVRTVRSPESLPPRIVIPGIRRIVFQRKSVMDWLAAHEITTAAPKPKVSATPSAPRKRGRPTKAEQVARGTA